MIDINKAGMTQLSNGAGQLGEWSVNLDDEELFKLSKDYNVTQMFEIRDVIKKMMDYAQKEATDEANNIAQIKINRIVEVGDAKLKGLAEENERLSLALEQHIIYEE